MPQLYRSYPRLVQCLNSPSVALLIRMVIALGHRHRLMAGEVVDLLDRDPQVQQAGSVSLSYWGLEYDVFSHIRPTIVMI